MRNQRFYIYTVFSVLTAFLSGILISDFLISSRIGSLMAVIVSFILYELAERTASRSSKDKFMKATLASVKPFYELVILIPVIVTLISIDTSSLLFQYLGISTVGAILLSQIVEEKTVNKMRRTVRPRLGQKVRMGTIIITLIFSVSNDFYIFYGILLLFLSALYDLVYMLAGSVQK